MNKLSKERIEEVLSYDPTTGLFTWIAPSGPRVRQGDLAGTVSGHGYRSIYIDGIKFRAHRLAWFLMTGQVPEQVDHINRERDDNRISNLRAATASQNRFNTVAHRDSGTGAKNVYRVKRGNCERWKVAMMVKGKTIRLGSFKTQEDAEIAASKARETHHGEFANHGRSGIAPMAEEASPTK